MRRSSDARTRSARGLVGCSFRCFGSNGVRYSRRLLSLRRLVDAGARVALGADDPLLFGSRLAEQYQSARVDHGFDDAGLATLARGSIEGSRAPESVRRELLAGVDRWLADPTAV